MIVALSIVIVLIAVLAWTPLRRRPFSSLGIAVVSIGFLMALILEPRWLLLPLSVAAMVALGSGVIIGTGPSGRRTRSTARRVAAALLAVSAVATASLAGATAWALPALELPPPSGPHAIGARDVQWDTGREESFTTDPNDTRMLVARVWYPTEASGPRTPYMASPAISQALADQFGIPAFLLDGVAHAKTNAVVNAPQADGSFPLVIFSPGLGGSRTQNTVWAENLASHGYIVVAVDHPYDSAAVVLEDGTVIRSSLATTGDDETDQRIANELASIRADDLLSTLDYFETILPSATVATAGHSIGGAAAILAAARDPRVDAVVDIDGLPRGGLPTVPVLAIVAGEGTGSAESDERYDSALDEVLAFCGKRVDVRGAQHLSFTDAALYLPPLPSLIGLEGRTAALTVANEETLAFLRGELGTGTNPCA